MPLFTRRVLLLLLAGCAPFALAALHGGFFALGVAVDLVILVAAGVDWLRCVPPRQVAVCRDLPAVLSLREPETVCLAVLNRARRAARVELKDCPPPSLRQARPVLATTVAAGGEDRVFYRVVPTRRGVESWSTIGIRTCGPWRLVQRQENRELPVSVAVYPTLSVLANVDLLVAQCGGHVSGTRRAPRGAAAMEFASLRDYVTGDDARHISWKHTAHRRRPITKEFEPERSQQVLLLLDCGRTMATDLDGIRRVDHATNAALALAKVSLDAGDEVGLVTFAAEVTRYLPPRGGRRQLGTLVHALADALAMPYESDYDAAFDALQFRQKRRALVVVFTEVVDRRTSERLVIRLRRLIPRHVPVCVTLRDPYLIRCQTGGVRGLDDVYEERVAGDLLEEREQALAVLRGRGGFVVDVPSAQLVPSAVRTYLQLKRRGQW